MGSRSIQSSLPNVVVTGEGLPSLPKKCVEKILAGEFINFAELPPAKGKVKSTHNAAESQIVVIQAADLRMLIPDLATWIQYLCSIYAAVIISKEADCAKKLAGI